MSFLTRSSPRPASTSGFITSVTASAPLTSSGGTTPNIAITAGTVAGQVYSWNAVGSVFDRTERAIRATGITSGTSLAMTSATTFAVSAGSSVNIAATTTSVISGTTVTLSASTAGGIALNALSGNVESTAGVNNVINAGNILVANAGAQLWISSDLFRWWGTGNVLFRTDTISGTAIQYQWASTVTAVVENFASKASGTGASRQIVAGDTAGATGGALDLRSGTGASATGAVTIRAGSQTVINIASGGTLTLGQSASSTSLGINAGTSASGSAGSASALPVLPAAYINVVFNGASGVVPFYNT